MNENTPIKAVLNRDAKGRFLPNNRANPKGRPPKDKSITNLMREMLDKPADKKFLSKEDYGKTWRQVVAKALLVKAIRGDSMAIRELLDRLEGKPTQSIVGGDGKPIILKVVYDDGNTDRI